MSVSLSALYKLKMERNSRMKGGDKIVGQKKDRMKKKVIKDRKKNKEKE